jgi:hypothetical protein
MKLLVMHFSPASYHFIPFGPNILLSTLFSNPLNVFSRSIIQLSLLCDSFDNYFHPCIPFLEVLDFNFGVKFVPVLN